MKGVTKNDWPKIFSNLSLNNYKTVYLGNAVGHGDSAGWTHLHLLLASTHTVDEQDFKLAGFPARCYAGWYRIFDMSNIRQKPNTGLQKKAN